MYTTLLVVMALCALTSLANPTPDLEKRFTKTRATQFSDSACMKKPILEAKSWDTDCVNIDGRTNSINMALGTGTKGHSSVHAFSKTGCTADTDMGEITSTGGIFPGKGSCIDVNFYMQSESNFYGFRITSIKFIG